MIPPRLLIIACVLSLFAAGSVAAAERVVAVRVTDLIGGPVPGIMLETTEGYRSGRTDNSGLTEIFLPDNTASALVTLRILAADKKWEFISPLDGRVPVLGAAERFAVVLVEPGTRAILQYPDLLKRCVRQTATELQSTASGGMTDEESMRAAMKILAVRFDLEEEDIVKAIERAAKEAPGSLSAVGDDDQGQRRVQLSFKGRRTAEPTWVRLEREGTILWEGESDRDGVVPFRLPETEEGASVIVDVPDYDYRARVFYGSGHQEEASLIVLDLARQGRISGTVMDRATAAVIEGAEVVLESRDGVNTLHTRTEGTFSFDTSAASLRDVTITVRHDEYMSRQEARSELRVPYYWEFRLERAYLQVAGHVVASDSQNSVKEASVSITVPGRYSGIVTTDAEGRWSARIPVELHGELAGVSVMARGYFGSHSGQIVLREGEKLETRLLPVAPPRRGSMRVGMDYGTYSSVREDARATYGAIDLLTRLPLVVGLAVRASDVKAQTVCDTLTTRGVEAYSEMIIPLGRTWKWSGGLHGGLEYQQLTYYYKMQTLNQKITESEFSLVIGSRYRYRFARCCSLEGLGDFVFSLRHEDEGRGYLKGMEGRLGVGIVMHFPNTNTYDR